MAHVADVQRSVDFYGLLGMEVRGSLRNPSGELQWVHLASEHAHLMFTRALEPATASQRAVLFYLYSPNLIALRDHLLANGVKVSLISHPDTCSRAKCAWRILTATRCSSASKT